SIQQELTEWVHILADQVFFCQTILIDQLLNTKCLSHFLLWLALHFCECKREYFLSLVGDNVLVSGYVLAHHLLIEKVGMNDGGVERINYTFLEYRHWG